MVIHITGAGNGTLGLSYEALQALRAETRRKLVLKRRKRKRPVRPWSETKARGMGRKARRKAAVLRKAAQN